MNKIISCSTYARGQLRRAQGGTVHSVYRKTANLRVGDGLLSLQARGTPASPLTLETDLDAAGFAALALKRGMEANFCESGLYLNGAFFDISCGELWEGELRPAEPLSAQRAAESLRRAAPRGGFADLTLPEGERWRSSAPACEAESILRRSGEQLRSGERADAARTLTELVGLGTSERLKLVYEPEDTTDDKTAVYWSSDESVAVVDQKGNVTSTGPGKCDIFAKVGEFTAVNHINVRIPLEAIAFSFDHLTIHYGDTVFQVEASEDGTNWNAESYAKATAGDCFKWKYVTDAQLGEDGIQYLNAVKTFHGRFVRLTAKDIGLTLFELIARGGDGKSIPMTLYAGAEEAGNLADEPFTLEGEPDWYNSTYFDEIYHARTAYELLHGMNCYEWTHPPLGKVMMSWAVAVFGMTPFGWRFAGALMGVIMLPGMYLLGKLLFRRRIGAVGMISLMALDFMHFTQTRIATIDSFVVCFIIWAYVWMLMWFKTDVWRKPLWKSLVPLLLSGVSMGLSIASKWTGCYAGVGLAILFFWGFFRHLAEARACRTAVKEERHTDMLPEATERGALPGADSEKLDSAAPFELQLRRAVKLR